MTEKAVIDRFEEDFAVILLNSGEKIVIPRHQLPDGASEGDWVNIDMDDDEEQDTEEAVIHIEVDEEETEAAQERIASKLERLRRGDHLHDLPDDEDHSQVD